MLAVLTVLLLPGFASPAHAETCTDALACTTDAVGDATDTVAGAVEATVDTAEEAAAGAVIDVADAVPDPVDRVTDPVLGDVVALLGHDGTSDPVSEPTDATGSTGGGETPGGGSGGTGSAPTSGDRHASPGGASHGEPPATTQRGRVNEPPSDAARASDTTDPVPTNRLPSPRDGAGTIERVVRALRFPALLIALIVLFLAFQQRGDRRDPKLARAPVDSRDETLVFR